MDNREALKKLNDMFVDAQYAHRIGNRVFTGVLNHEDCKELSKIADDLIISIKSWKAAIPSEGQSITLNSTE